jgi:hypothetical protein
MGIRWKRFRASRFQPFRSPKNPRITNKIEPFGLRSFAVFAPFPRFQTYTHGFGNGSPSGTSFAICSFPEIRNNGSSFE